MVRGAKTIERTNYTTRGALISLSTCKRVGLVELRPEHRTVRRLQIHLTIARLPYGSLVIARLNAELKDNRESFELRKVHPASVDHSLDWVDHLVREGGDLHQEGCHAWEESQGPWMLRKEVEKVRPGICFQHVGLCMTVD